MPIIEKGGRQRPRAIEGECVMTRLGARIGGALVGGLIGFAIGPVTGSWLAEFAAGKSGSPGPGEVGRFCGMGAGLLVGAFLGAFPVGRPIVARWCYGMAFPG